MSGTDKKFNPFYYKMKAENLPDLVIDNFRHYFDKLIQGDDGLIAEKDILPAESLPDIEDFQDGDLARIGKDMLEKAVVIKLNGGLGTSMGMDKPKGLLEVKNSLTFLDITVRQNRKPGPGVPVVFMNSFYTRNDTLAALLPYSDFYDRSLPPDFLQHKIPKIDARDLTPASLADNRILEWCPPGHGNVFPAIAQSGLLDRLLDNGYEFAFISNIDNLGAVMDVSLLGYFVKQGFSFMIEAAERTPSDRKGGHLARLKSGALILREAAQCPENDTDSFQDINRHKYFNTNNIWIHLPSLKKNLNKQNGILDLPMIRNEKTLDPRDPNSPPVYQLETAMGSAVFSFDNTGAVKVPGTRFLPVKTTADLLEVRSDRYILDESFRVVPNPERGTRDINIHLDPAYYKFIDDFEARFPKGAPSLANCRSLSIKGDVRFPGKVAIEGCVSIPETQDKSVEFVKQDRLADECRFDSSAPGI